ncbi:MULTISPECIES: hypothetical protein [unclassified Acidovorax]|uniref:hypothetical protein n=1 Tax=unclassified Acidovorax TaxID=2684926 RepID=UPI0028831EDF|nr:MULTISPECIES: hypothetical protein [unclassified Acidovorax]
MKSIFLDDPKSNFKPFVIILFLLLFVYGFWLSVFWPGVLGEDSYSILLEVENPGIHNSGKPAFWLYFVRIFYENSRLAELPIAALLTVAAVVFARIIGWCWSERLFKTALFCFIFICLAPHLIFFMGNLYPDGVYSACVAGLLFEIWLVATKRRASASNLAMLAITIPFAAFARPNGIVFLAPVAILLFFTVKSSRIWIAAILIGWCSIMAFATANQGSRGHGALYPLVIFETVNFLQPRPMNLWTASPRVSALTIETLKKHKPIDNYLKFYDPDYWDPLQFQPEGPRALTFPREDQKIIVREFFTYNLWRNIPKFLASRVNIFMVSAFAQGGIPSFEYAEHVLKILHTNSSYRKFALSKSEEVLKKIHEASYNTRMLFWTPFLGIGLLIWSLVIGIREGDAALLIICTPMAVQLIAIFAFSIAGEYRYLLPFFTLPLVLLPAWATRRATIPN